MAINNHTKAKTVDVSHTGKDADLPDPMIVLTVDLKSQLLNTI